MSLEIIFNGRADSVCGLESYRRESDKASSPNSVRGLSPRYGSESRNMNLGDPSHFPQRETSRQPRKGGGSLEGVMGVGLAHSRGVARQRLVTEESDPKGLAESEEVEEQGVDKRCPHRKL